MPEITTRLVELISSKVCHDLISPVGAISNGVEILEEMGADDDVTALISFSATQANAKLKTLRMAYGLGGSDESIKIEDIHKTFDDFISGDNRVSQNWSPSMTLSFETRKGFPKLLMCALMLVGESLPKGGKVEVKPHDENTIVIIGRGENATFRQGYVDALAQSTDVENLDPKLIHPYITGLFAQQYGFEITPDECGDGFISLRLKQASVS